MAKSAYIGDTSSLAKKIKKMYVGDANGVARKVKKAYVGDANGIARLFYSGSGGTYIVSGNGIYETEDFVSLGSKVGTLPSNAQCGNHTMKCATYTNGKYWISSNGKIFYSSSLEGTWTTLTLPYQSSCTSLDSTSNYVLMDGTFVDTYNRSSARPYIINCDGTIKTYYDEGVTNDYYKYGGHTAVNSDRSKLVFTTYWTNRQGYASDFQGNAYALNNSNGTVKQNSCGSTYGSICYGYGMFFGLAFSYTQLGFRYSADGTTWSTVNNVTPKTNAASAIEYYNGLFVYTDTHSIYTFANPYVPYPERRLSLTNSNFAFYKAKDKLYAIANKSSNTAHTYYSTDGISWTDAGVHSFAIVGAFEAHE